MKLQKKPRGKFGFAIRFWRFASGAAHFGNARLWKTSAIALAQSMLS
ncbi:MAG: hypothetical protein WCC46_15535 [Terriglobales bacterium]|jgi:hypothetical protein